MTTATTGLRFHWGSALDSGQKGSTEQYRSDVLDLEGALDFAREADRLGVESLLMAQSYSLPDPLPLLGAMAQATRNVRFILAYRPGLLSPTLFAQIVNTVSWMSKGRVALNLVAGISPVEQAYYGDFLAHDDRYARAEEFADILRRLWSGETPLTYEGAHYQLRDAQLGLGPYEGRRPEIYVSGASEPAQAMARTYGDCWFRYGDTPAETAKVTGPFRERGCGVGLRMQVLARETRQEALSALADVMSETDDDQRRSVARFVAAADSQAVRNSFRLAAQAKGDWLSPMIYSGAVALRGGPALCLVGSYVEVAAYLLEYKAAGVSQFIFSGWPARDEMRHFFTRVLPLVRELEQTCEPDWAGRPHESARTGAAS